MADNLDSRVRHRRTFATLSRALARKETYLAATRILLRARRPIDFLLRYATKYGEYPAFIEVRTPTGLIKIETFSQDDVATINEIFFRGDYDMPHDADIIVDFGSNIGVSALYFLSRKENSFVYCFEPLEKNAERLRRNLSSFTRRYDLDEAAVGESAGVVRFGWEPTGKYGGIGRDTGNWTEVVCRDSNEVLNKVIEKHGRIDLLKIDVETLEKILTERIPAETLKNIRGLCVEYSFTGNPLEATHNWERRNSITAFTIRDAVESGRNLPN